MGAAKIQCAFSYLQIDLRFLDLKSRWLLSKAKAHSAQDVARDASAMSSRLVTKTKQNKKYNNNKHINDN